ncbi:hypothetical protein CC1G_11611 [Coprinopsis cinerea okayama7|uniref:Uncharacterized protein n=1 Tax=Coprinopsis cinerea (strain Okayama-7 / 130 / ATCC MYA-4618 / FGSC 9003) TaxID=240176 RepID=A8PCR3_COPC7|nr:hypothetical protein CC1G_11611 [Coprinopsis cinerea okayama7\|eukprot:XP_001840454.2 hypothetical protein CC1G_11611 [Coprinopsis cinerea okayama7\
MGILFYLALSVAAFGWSEFNSNSDGELWDPLTIQEFTSDVLDTINKDAAQTASSEPEQRFGFNAEDWMNRNA